MIRLLHVQKTSSQGKTAHLDSEKWLLVWRKETHLSTLRNRKKRMQLSFLLWGQCLCFFRVGSRRKQYLLRRFEERARESINIQVNCTQNRYPTYPNFIANHSYSGCYVCHNRQIKVIGCHPVNNWCSATKTGQYAVDASTHPANAYTHSLSKHKLKFITPNHLMYSGKWLTISVYTTLGRRKILFYSLFRQPPAPITRRSDFFDIAPIIQ